MNRINATPQQTTEAVGRGWSHTDGKSVNAATAHLRGALTASELATELSIPAGFVHARYNTDEWHHTSVYANKTAYYDMATVEADALSAEGKAALKAWRKEQAKTTTLHNQVVEWLEWGGSKRRPTCTERRAYGCTVELRGASAYITLPDGSQMTKRQATKGLHWRGHKEASRAAVARLRRIAVRLTGQPV